MLDKKTLIGKILILFKWLDIPITLFFVAALTIIGIFGSWAYVISLIVLAIIGIAAFTVAMLVNDYLYEKQTKIRNPYFKSFLKFIPIYYIVRVFWLGLFVLILISILKLIP